MTLPIWNTNAGVILIAQENDVVNLGLNFTNPDAGPITAQIISGSLPDGLSMNLAGFISGTVSYEPVLDTYSFTVRLTNASGIQDRTFGIEVQDFVPAWNDPANLGTYVHYSYLEYQFTVYDPGHLIQRFVKIGGELPPGLYFDDSGKLSGIISIIDAPSTYTFTIRAQMDETKFLDRTFTIDVVIVGNRAPLWLTPRGLLGEILFGIPYSIQLFAGDPDSETITYGAIGLPPGFSINPATGVVSGTLSSSIPQVYSFTATAQDGAATSSRIFIFNANNVVVQPIIWITPSGSIGEINEGDKSLLFVRAESESTWLRYDLTSGTLPPGITLDINSGDMWGMALEQGVDTTYTFTLRAYNSTSEEFRTFSIDVLHVLVPGATLIEAALFGDDKLLWNDLFTTDKIAIGEAFRQGDDQYGLVEKPRILIAQNLNAPTADQTYLALQNVRRTYLTLGRVQVAVAVHNDEIMYEVLYRKVYDDSNQAALEFTHPETFQIVKPGSIENLRTRLLALGSSGGTDRLPLWMTSEQIIGDSSSILGFTPAIVFANVKPGSGQDIANKINQVDIQREKLYLRRVRIDRIIRSPQADNTFEPGFILFDNQY